MTHVFRWLFHFFSYYITWFVCIFYAAADDAWLGPMLALLIISGQIFLQIISNSPWRLELIFAIMLMITGILIDTVFLHTGWIIFKANPFAQVISPPWIACLWLSFGFTITITSRAWLHRYVLFGILTFISLPFAYWLGAVTGAAVVENWWFYPVLGSVWMILLPLLLRFYLFKSKDLP